MGKRGDAVVFASESCALDVIDAKFVRDIEPGEIVVVENGQITSIRDNIAPKGETSLCIFEHIYFARPDSKLDGQYVNEARRNAGGFLAKQAPVDADAVVGVPDSGMSAAYGYSLESGIPMVEGFIKNRYIGRTFIDPGQSNREKLVKMKLNPVTNYIKGKRVVMVDDSIVRGTTCGRIVKLLRDSGAKEVHLRISSPPFLYPCYFGSDVPDRKLLIATQNTTEQIRQILNADSLEYLTFENMMKIAPNSTCGMCHGCFSGVYPMDVEKYHTAK